ncbi:Arv1-like family-domain-containing protein [Podospora fimiseda]|uniref:Protein ARV n=1 Tax=Podospora fimiseda TaxID=252190 RepID=A0AAN7BY30_9PEZI|nr:Arv1-like family-domain-containing protein [Podospora fimiseda]
MSSSQLMSSSTFRPATRDPDAASIRPRNRRNISIRHDTDSSSAPASPSRSPNRVNSLPAPHIGLVTGRNNSSREVARTPARPRTSAAGNGLLGASWAPSWASIQDLATSLIASGEALINGEPHRPSARSRGQRGNNNWGPEPPAESRPRSDDIAAGSRAEREAALKAKKTASVLESHQGVNGGLDYAGKFKKRSSDEDLRRTASNEETAEHLVYIHHVQPTDTYAGIVLKYRCREDSFRKANGLWSRDNIQIRKWLMIPVDACEVKGRPCDAPLDPGGKVDLLAQTPEEASPFNHSNTNDFFSNSTSNGKSSDLTQQLDDDKPWTHLRWVSIDSHPHPVEVARVSRKTLGYFPPRRKKSIHTTSTTTASTPRGSVDIPSFSLSEPAITERPSSYSSSTRPHSILKHAHPHLPTVPEPSEEGQDKRPEWMRRPGGVGSLGRSVKAPGPQKDYFNKWAKNYVPGFTYDSLPSMSVMGSERAKFGFDEALKGIDDPAPANVAIVESPFGEGGDSTVAAGKGGSGNQGTGLDKAALAVETWLRGALERAESGLRTTPVLGPLRGGGQGGERERDRDADLIELEIKTLWREGAATTAKSSSGAHGESGVSSAAGAGGHNIRLTVCKNCGRFCDKYVEHDFVVLFIDLVLIKPQVYRHLLHNTLMKTEKDEFAPSIVRLGVLLLLFDVYLTWARVERQGGDGGGGGVGGVGGVLEGWGIGGQYLFFLVLCTLSTGAFHMSIRFLTSSRYSPLNWLGILPRYSRPNSVSTALLVSSSTKLFPILMVIWEYDVPAAARSLGWAVVANNVEALKILLDCGYGVAALLATAGAVSRWAMGRAVLWAAGLEGVEGSVAVSVSGVGEPSVAEDGRALGNLLISLKDWAGRLAVG